MKRIQQAEAVLQRCCSKQQLNHHEIKAMFQMLSICIMELHQQQARQKREVRQGFHEERVHYHQALRYQEETSSQQLAKTKLELTDKFRKMNEEMERKMSDAKSLARKEAQALEEMITTTVGRVSKLEEQSELSIELRKSLTRTGDKINQKLDQLFSTPTIRRQMQEIQREKRQREQHKKQLERREKERRKKQQQQIQQRKQAYQKQQEELKQIIIKRARVDCWSQLSRQKQLSLYGCGLKKLPDQIGNLTKLTKLWLCRNKLNEMPNTLVTLNNLQLLGLSNNQLKQMPESISKLINLQILYLNNNQLQEVPQSVGNLINLHQLNLSNNQLRGLPQSMVRLVGLRHRMENIAAKQCNKQYTD